MAASLTLRTGRLFLFCFSTLETGFVGLFCEHGLRYRRRVHKPISQRGRIDGCEKFFLHTSLIEGMGFFL
jgi:hypothetical protein